MFVTTSEPPPKPTPGQIKQAWQRAEMANPKLVRFFGAIPNAVLVLIACVMPVVCVIFITIWAGSDNDEDTLSNVWTAETSSLYKDERYKDEIFPPEESTSPANFLITGRLRDGGNYLTADALLDLRDRLKEVEEETTVTVDGMTFTFKDVCSSFQPYLFPCMRFTPLDCFKEGQFDFPASAAAIWRNGVKNTAIAQLRMALITQAVAQTALPVAPYLCGTHCLTNGQLGGYHKLLAGLLGVPAGPWQDPALNPACTACLPNFVENEAFLEAMGDTLYYPAAKQVMITLGQLGSIPGLPPAAAAPYFNSRNNTELDGDILAALETMVGLDNTQNPYTCANVAQTLSCRAPKGGPRPELIDASNNTMSSEEVQRVVSEDCFNWDEGQYLPAYNRYLFYGGIEPAVEAENYTSMQAFSALFLLIPPKSIMTRVAHPLRPGGQLTLTEEQAEEVLVEMKLALEEKAGNGFDDDSLTNEFSSFTDDSYVGGTFRTAMVKMNRASSTVMWIFYIILPVYSMIFFINCRNPLVESRMPLIVFGVISIILGFFGAMGITVAFDIRPNVVHYGILPFLLVGIGVDDVYMVAMSTEDVEGSSAEERFVKAMSTVSSPVAMTSLMNAIIFLVLFIICDVGAVYKAALTGLWSCSFNYFNVMFTFAPLILLDLRRRHANRVDVVMCIKRENIEKTEEKGGSKCTIHNMISRKILTTMIGKIAILVAALVIFVLACIRLKGLPVGLNMEDFFPADTQGAAYAATKAEYFPTWPASVNWGELDYMNPSTQMKIAKMFENVQTSKYVTDGIPTTMVWTSAVATWAIPSAFKIDGVNPCSLGNQITQGKCGEKIGCDATFMEDTQGLKLFEETAGVGYCFRGSTLINSLSPADPRRSDFQTDSTYCPVVNWNASQLETCVTAWHNTPWKNIVSPSFAMDDGGNIKFPIKYSKSGGQLFYTILTYSNDDYVGLIEGSRKFIDDEDSVHAWLAGTAYRYWEQYLQIVPFTFEVSGISVAVAFVVAFIFLMIEFSLRAEEKNFGKFALVALIGAFLISVLSALATVTVIGFCGWFEIKFSVFTSASCILSTGFTVEYTVHVIHHFVQSQSETANERVDDAMNHLTWPMCLSFLSSLISVVMLVFINVQFMTKYFMGPLLIVILSTFFYGVWVPAALLGFCPFMPRIQMQSDSLQDNGKSEESEITL